MTLFDALGFRWDRSVMAENADDLRCAQWVITQGAAKRGEGDE